ncbi:MAG: DUF309 domain-containing protein [Campylobacterales bacterium]
MSESVVIFACQFKRALVAGDYRLAHEIAEGHWRLGHREAALLAKGYCNAATALVLKGLGRDDAAKRVWATFEKYRPLQCWLSSEERLMIEVLDHLLEEALHS